jgi:hypothetical protein
MDISLYMSSKDHHIGSIAAYNIWLKRNIDSDCQQILTDTQNGYRKLLEEMRRHHIIGTGLLFKRI